MQSFSPDEHQARCASPASGELFDDIALPADRPLPPVKDILRQLGRGYDFQMIEAAKRVLATKSEGAEILLAGLCKNLGWEANGEASGCSSVALMGALQHAASREIRQWIRAKLDSLKDDDEHPFRVRDVFQIYSMARLQAEERLSLGEFEKRVEAADHPGLSHDCTTLSVELERALREENDPDYAFGELRRFAGPLLCLLGTPGEAANLQINRASAVGVFKPFMRTDEHLAAMACILIEEADREMLRKPEKVENLINGVVIVRHSLGEELDAAIKDHLEEHSVNPILHVLLTKPMSELIQQS